MEQEKTASERSVFLLALAGAAVLTVITWLIGGRFSRFVLPPDQGSWWYYWQRADPGFWSRFSVWTGYALHQAAVWALLVFAVREKHHPGKATRLNIIALAVNGFFIVAHLVQTHIWYDGLAQDVPIWTSQYSVIVMLVLMLAMLTPRRGIILGIPMKVPARGMGFLFAFTYVFGLSKKLLYRIGSIVLFFALAVFVYAYRGYNHAFEILFIPTALYGGAIALILILRLFAADRKPVKAVS